MMRRPVIMAILKKDLASLLPLALGVFVLLVAEVLVSELDIELHSDVMRLLEGFMPVLCILAMGLVIIALVQEDPADSHHHDWLARPISRLELGAAKLFAVLIIIALPIFVTRFVVGLAVGHSPLESLLTASYFREGTTPVVLAVFAAVALLVRSVAQGLVLSLAILALGVLPLWLVEILAQPSPDALLDDGTAQGVWWLYMLPMGVLIYLALALVFLFQYVRRNFMAARTAFGVTMLVASPLIALPFFLPAWPLFFAALEASVSDADDEVAQDVRLYPAHECFPAVMIPASSPGDYAYPEDMIGESFWREGEFYEISHGALTYSTTFAARNVPIDWRVVPMKSAAEYEADGTSVRLRPARNIAQHAYGKYDDTATHYWFVPDDTVDALSISPQVSLTQVHYLALLAPTAHDIEADGERHYYEGLGFCSADRDTVRNEVEVDCFKRGEQPTLVSAELVDVPSSRVDAGPPDYAPDWLQWISGQRYELTVESPSLVEGTRVRVTAYRVRAYIRKKMQLPGLLGDHPSQCPLPSPDAGEPRFADWHDSSPHDERSVTVDGDVRIEVLDWGGTGPAVLFIPGLGATAHSFDTIAPMLTDDLRVLAMTRRGFGGSSRVERGYTTARLSQDVLQVMDALELESPILVGHSAAGEELSWIGANRPENIGGLIYLDAAYDRTVDNRRVRELARKLPLRPRIGKSDLASYEAADRFLERMGSPGAPEGELMAMIDLASGTRNFDPRVPEALMAQVKAPEYHRIGVPALALYAVPTAPEWEPWFDREDPYIQEAVEALFDARQANQEIQIEQFARQVNSGRVQRVLDADHYILASNVEEVVETIRKFALSLTSPAGDSHQPW